MKPRWIVSALLFVACVLLVVGSASAQSTITVQTQFALTTSSPWPGSLHPIPPVVPVAILSSRTFDARMVDPQSLILTMNGGKALGSNGKSPCKEADINRDSLLDLVCVIRVTPSSLEPSTRVAVLEGRTVEGTRIRGELALYVPLDR